jgi:hypothetical protein
MKRIVAFLAAVCVISGICLAASASAQDSPPPPPTDAAGDTVSTSPAAPAAPAAAAPKAAQDTTAAAGARARRMQRSENERTFIIYLGIGSGLEYKPDVMADNYSPLLGGTLGFGVRQYGITLAANFGYNFFLANGTVPNDLNILTMFVDVRYTPFHTKARPYVVACGGYWRQWVVDLDYTDSVLGFGGGVGVDVEVDRTKRLFVDVRYLQGQTRELQPGINEDQANTEIIPMRLGLLWEIR